MGMRFKPPFSNGEVVSNAVMTEAFKAGNMGGMCCSKTTGTLVLISDNTKGLYNDKWHDGILHYTGMGKVGDQTLSGNQNKTLAESKTNGV
jgi:5-methylcytosine-specific restriction protein A